MREASPRWGITTTGTWTKLNMYHLSRRFEKNVNVLPLTAGVLETLPEVISMVRGAAKVSVIEGGTHLRPHCGPSNTRMRIHLGLSVPPGCEIRVGNRTRGWPRGEPSPSTTPSSTRCGTAAAAADRADRRRVAPGHDGGAAPDSIRNEPELLSGTCTTRRRSSGPTGGFRGRNTFSSLEGRSHQHSPHTRRPRAAAAAGLPISSVPSQLPRHCTPPTHPRPPVPAAAIADAFQG